MGAPKAPEEGFIVVRQERWAQKVHVCPEEAKTWEEALHFVERAFGNPVGKPEFRDTLESDTFEVYRADDPDEEDLNV